ncbi:sugar ABC transporter permease [Paenibacillus baekrokdamisoli]|uniref:Sugar ABC transporter permease n=1 Tax=Paenibacillus baekrokdamisoli TaxID=1712516 RepID=A0A3G9IRL9_9BACL|nr:carbohydrate ABC transporter permease [Paenibacillus baekrokdamisoli]MBB3071092.1 putative aldouronate transport system permease protein [Paenibacillus baekrokdamisoli]BBH21510.1 sugar ABC transporter permease [Paenibacillus baekrokdamisoli]
MKLKNGSIAISIVHVLFGLVALAMLLPLLLVVAVSLSDENAVVKYGYRFIPEQFSLKGYQVVFHNPGILVSAYSITLIVTIAGTLVSLLFTAMVAYVMSRKDYRYRKATTFFVVFTMLFNGGLVPFYILIVKYLHMKDTMWVLILPYLINPFYVMIMKGFLDRMPTEIIESAKMDGAGEYRSFFTIVLPLSTPALATVGLFISFVYWNDWWLGLLFVDNEKLVPLQLLLYRTMNSIEFYATNSQYLSGNVDISQFPSLTTRMALAVLGAGPMLFIFPFFQRYFVKGLTVGSLKE